MFKHILVPSDGSQLSQNAALKAIVLAKSESARITAVTVTPPFRAAAGEFVMTGNTEELYNEACADRAADYLDFIRNAAEAAGVVAHGMHVFHEQPYAAIIEAARENNCDLICMASHGRKGVSALVMGSETVKVLTHTNLPVLVWR